MTARTFDRPRWSDAVLLLLGIYLAALAWWQIAIEQHDFSLDEWLISYAGGPVRRGPTGSLVFAASELAGISPRHVVLALVLLINAVFLVAVAGLVRPIRGHPATWFILFSPAILLFPTFDPDGSHRKEILLFAVLATSLAISVAGRPRTAIRTFALSAPVIVLVHEGLAAYLPYGLVLVGLAHPDRRDARWIAAGIVAAGAATTLAIAYPGDPSHVAAICRQATDWPDLKRATDCPGIGAIGWLAHGTEVPDLFQSEARRELVDWILPAILVPLLGFLPALWSLRKVERPLHWLATGAVISMLCSVALFFVAIDWGRFVHIHATCLGLCLLALLHRAQIKDAPARTRPIPALIAAAAVLIYATVWHLHHYRQPFIPTGGMGHWGAFATEVSDHFSGLRDTD